MRRLSILLAILAASVIATAQDSPTAVLVDQFGKTGCEDRAVRILSFARDLESNPESRGYIVTYTQPDIETKRFFRLEEGFRGALREWNLDRSRITFVRVKPAEVFRTELWIVPPGSKIPAFPEVVWKYDLEKPEKFYDLINSGSPCSDAPEEMFSVILNENPTYRGRISITERSDQKYRKLLSEIKTKLASVDSSRLRFFRRRDCTRDTCGRYQLWLIPPKSQKQKGH